MTMNEMDKTTQPSSEAPVVRLMVLETDKPHPDTYSERGSFGKIVHEHFSKAGKAHHPPLGVETDQIFVVTESGGKMPVVSDFDRFDGLLITGSVYDAHGNNPWILELLSLLKELWVTRPDFHFLGVCFGHQLLARMLGGEVRPAPTQDWELGHSRITLTGAGQRLFRTRENYVFLHQMHQDQVVDLPGGMGYWNQGRRLSVGDRAHLAFDEDMVKRQIQIRVDGGGIKDLEHADRAAETAHLEHDGVEVAKAILRLFVYDDDGMGYERK
ncbi:uncharacterized protein N7469_000798 [Penicillium citrinum]|uniref:Glutamine amidotransferase domain-containing protein n=1 Tax=Penicillium citrinum TaxID=5077 RepID=A0A9W9TV27_PENCI|nr:uncharacterized protein N7469_000798 [Penicillium citrinum]KAJ5242471.1 hypothetical protein N7469_000798 [Penicillium citrinum]